MNGEIPDGKISDFISECLRPDGVTILRIIADNCGDLAVAELVFRLWNDYRVTRFQDQTGTVFLIKSVLHCFFFFCATKEVEKEKGVLKQYP